MKIDLLNRIFNRLFPDRNIMILLAMLLVTSCNSIQGIKSQEIQSEKKKYKGWYSSSIKSALEKGVCIDFIGIFIRKSSGDKNYALRVNAIKPRHESVYISKKELLNRLDGLIKDEKGDASELGILINADPNVTINQLNGILIELAKRNIKHIQLFNIIEGDILEIYSDMNSENLKIPEPPKPPEVEHENRETLER